MAGLHRRGWVLFSVILAICLQGVISQTSCGTRQIDYRIVGGSDADLGSWPWIGSLGFSGVTHSCGATLLDSNWAVTAAHCVGEFDTIAVGFVSFLDGSVHREERRVVVHRHPGYDNVTLLNDIAILQLRSPIEFNEFVRPACIASLTPEVNHYEDCMIAGWGTLESGGPFPDELQEARVRLFNQSECIDFLGDDSFDSDVMICGGFRDGRADSCQGDSGGPFMCRDEEGLWNLVGITSWGVGCGLPELPGVYTRVTAYSEFIELYLNAEMFTCDEGGLIFPSQVCDFEVNCNQSVSDERGCDFLQVGFNITLTSPNYPQSYPNDQHKEYLLVSERDSHLRVQWLDFELESDFDFVEVSFDRERYAVFTGSGLPDDFVTPSNVLWVTFTSDVSVRRRGFAMDVTVIPGNGTSNCTVDEDCRRQEFCNMSKCQCLPGFTVEFGMCVDIDECSRPRACNDSNSECFNLEGSYRCSCIYGFEEVNGTGCREIPVRCGTITDGSPRPRIVGGTNADRGNWPWIGSLQSYFGGHVCGATLISPDWAVTAAHCGGHYDKIVFGDQKQLEWSRYHQESEVQSFVHPEFDGDVYRDIAMVHLRTPVHYSHHVSPVCLPQAEGNHFENCWIAGWGTTQFEGVSPDILQEANINLFNSSVCERYLGSLFIPDYMLCAGLIEGGKDTCQGDSGGPLVCEGEDGSWTLVGATSWGIGCGDPMSPGVYTNIAGHLDFIRETISQDYFHCDNGDIVPLNKACDLKVDCGDWSDEARCPPLRDGEEVFISFSGCHDVLDHEPPPEWIVRAQRGLLLRVSFESFDVGRGSLSIASNSTYVEFNDNEVPEDRAFSGSFINILLHCSGSHAEFSLNVHATSEDLQLCDDGVIYREEMRCDYVVSCSNEKSPYYDEENCGKGGDAVAVVHARDDSSNQNLLSAGDVITIQSPRYPWTYPNNSLVRWYFQAEEGHHFEVNFREFDLEESYDFLTIGNGSMIGDWRETVFSLTGIRPEPTVVVQSDRMWVEFLSDFIISGPGFSAEIFVVEDVVEVPCVRYIEREAEGELFRSSPTDGKDCQLVLVTSKKERFRIQIEVSVDCSEGESFTLRTSSKEKSYCGEKLSRVWWSDNNVVVIDYRFHGNRRGGKRFLLRFSTANDPTPTVGCNRFFSGGRGIVKSPRYPDNYSNNRQCVTRIVAEPGQKIALTFQHFRMQGAYPFCKNDYMEIEDVLSGESIKWCGNQRDVSAMDFVSDSFYLKITFSSNRLRNFQGYSGNFLVLK